MKKTDYAKIAQQYERNKYRLDVQQDYDLKDFMDRANYHSFRVLDLACGTGIYLAKQIDFFKNIDIEWHGLDASDDMLKIAKGKIAHADLRKGVAENLPYKNEYFDFIVSNYALHHFEGKHAALNEMARTIKKDGVCKIHNIAIQDMQKWWVFQYFPSAYYEDLKRFWPKELLFHELTVRGFDVEVRMVYKMKAVYIAELIQYARNKDISSITLVDDAEYHIGLERMEYELKKDPEMRAVSDIAEIFFIAKKEPA